MGVPDGSSYSSSKCCGVLLDSSVVYDVEVSECCDSEVEKKVCDVEGQTSLEPLEISIAFCRTAERKMFKIGKSEQKNDMSSFCMSFLEPSDVEGRVEFRASSLVTILLFGWDSLIVNCIQSKYTYFFVLFPPADPDFVFFNDALHLTYLYYSIVLLAMCDSDYQFTYINVGSCGTDSDSTIFKGSTLFTKINNEDIMLPPPKPLPNTTEPLPYMIIGDSAFGISNKVLRPYALTDLTTKKKIFNYRMSRARRPMNTSLPNTIKIVKACCILHNYIRKRDGYRVEDTLTVVGFQELNMNGNITRSGDMIRDKFANYFVSPSGSVPWQDTLIICFMINKP
ncbi:protein ALP1-like [Aphis craccivora]|uniref:Protein ALP1-like n=1 Tax=Aphis craccivora TaxID=307492 RepID=A0A6G0W2B9_APHCR|nr:protein ALP1-like [Aphis craccivora]